MFVIDLLHYNANTLLLQAKVCYEIQEKTKFWWGKRYKEHNFIPGFDEK